MQRATADAPRSLQGSTPITHDANFDSLDARHACFTVTLRTVAGESRAMHAIDQWHPRLRIDAPGREVELVDARVVVEANQRAELPASRLIQYEPPRTCGAAAYSTLIPAVPLMLLAPVATILWLATEMPRHQARCNASVRTGLVEDGTAEVESVRAAVCFDEAIEQDDRPTQFELSVADPLRHDALVRWQWRVAR